MKLTYILFAILTGFPVVSAEIFEGYYEDFNEQYPPDPTPTAWYTFDPQTGTQWIIDAGELTDGCPTACSSDNAIFTFPTDVNNQPFTIDFDYRFNRVDNVPPKTTANGCDHENDGDWVGSTCTSGIFLIGRATPGGANIILAGISWTPSSGVYNTLTSTSQLCSMTNPSTNSESTVSGHITVQYVHTPIETFYVSTGYDSCSQVATGGSADNLKVIRFSAGEGLRENGQGYIDNLVWNRHDGATFELIEAPGIIEPAEFDSGLIAFADSLGFKSTESRYMFALIMVALATIVIAFGTAFFGEGGWRMWIIHGFAVLVGIFMVLLGFIELWIFTIALIVGSFGVRGAHETRNTFSYLLRFNRPSTALVVGENPQEVTGAPLVMETPQETIPEPDTTTESKSGDEAE